MPNYKHLLSMTDETGMIQFSRLSSPDPGSGYTLDDNARALMVAFYMEEAETPAATYINNLVRARQADGSWCNLLVQGRYYNTRDSEDSMGRSLLACSLGLRCPWIQIKEICIDLLNQFLPEVAGFTSPRAIAYGLLALSAGTPPDWSENQRMALVHKLSDYLTALYQVKHAPGWFWFEDYLTYCNGIIPQALLAAYQVTSEKQILKIGHDALKFLNDILFREGYLNIIGNRDWLDRGSRPALFDQQPVDAASIAFACHQAYQVLGRTEYRDLSQLACEWYRGRNIHGLSLVDPLTGGCYDALTPQGVNRNQGAEAVLSLLLSDLLAEGVMAGEQGDRSVVPY